MKTQSWGTISKLAGVTWLLLAGCSTSAGGGSTTAGAGTTAGGNTTGGASTTGGGTTTGAGNTTGGSGTTGGSTTGGSGATGGTSTGGSCEKFTGQATQGPAAIVVIADRSALMAVNATWPVAGSAIVNALDGDAFDHQTLGLIAYPQTFVDPTSCLCDSALQGLCGHGDIGCCKTYISGVTCGEPMLPPVPLADAQTAKASGTGVRHDIQQFLTATSPISSSDNGAPAYEAIAATYAALRGAAPATRGAVLLSASSFNCTSFAAAARPGYLDGNSCPDWEEPDTVNALIANAYSDPTTPIRTVVIGLPGSDSAGQKTGQFDTAPYHMKLALSTYAVSGAPTAVDPSCSSSATFSQAGQDPAVPCHFDLSNSTTFDANSLARAIAIGRQRIMGCTYDLPIPPSGQSIDPALVNVDLTLAGVKSTLLKRTTPSDACTSDGCWDYATGKVQLIGLSCVNLLSASDGRVDIRVGCPTMTK